MSPTIAVSIPETAPLAQDVKPIDSDVVEVALLLPRWQALALVTAAQQRGMSAGQLLRRLIGATVGGQPPLASS